MLLQRKHVVQKDTRRKDQKSKIYLIIACLFRSYNGTEYPVTSSIVKQGKYVYGEDKFLAFIKQIRYTIFSRVILR